MPKPTKKTTPAAPSSEPLPPQLTEPMPPEIRKADEQPRHSREEVQAINMAAAHLGGVLELSHDEKLSLSGRLFLLAHNPLPEEKEETGTERMTVMMHYEARLKQAVDDVIGRMTGCPLPNCNACRRNRTTVERLVAVARSMP